MWPNGKEEKVWDNIDIFSTTNQFDLKNLIEKGFESAFGNAVFQSGVGGEGNLFAISPINILIANDTAIAGEFAFYFRTEGGGVCKERLSLFFKRDTSNETLKWALSKGLAYQSVYFANRCLDPSFVIPSQAMIEYSIFERPWEFLKTKVTGSYEPFAVSFFGSFDSTIEKLPKEMKYRECVQYGTTSSGGVRCIYSEERAVRDIDWKGHSREEKEFLWDWVLEGK
ncbi:hypothetical protein [Leptospira kmetyi]|uniref:hypothetical protein n=1 Tax=Leptospira kmetyi TaxID=408139 RepID=UPI0010826570|nr:hypothetical protein [Leptospira kmetyi]TGL72796.1 hypothetical protein EHQ67_00045 [Leptospira kmetyi]